jgi:hypothetical protein
MFSKIVDLFIYVATSFFVTIFNLALINVGFWLLKGNIVQYDTWHCLVAYILTSIITFKILFTEEK